MQLPHNHTPSNQNRSKGHPACMKVAAGFYPCLPLHCGYCIKETKQGCLTTLFLVTVANKGRAESTFWYTAVVICRMHCSNLLMCCTLHVPHSCSVGTCMQLARWCLIMHGCSAAVIASINIGWVLLESQWRSHYHSCSALLVPEAGKPG